MKERWQALLVKFEALSRRERLMVLAACVVVIVAVLNALLLDPVTARNRTLTGQLATDRAQVSALQQQLQVLANTPVVDPDAANRARLDAVLVQLQQESAALERFQQQLISPEKMPVLLDDILKKHGQLKLVSLKTQPVSEIRTTESAATNIANPSASASVVYRHGVVLKVQGRYLDLLDYLQALEKLPWYMLWGSAELTAEAYPQCTLTLTIHTLSLDKVWLSI